MKATLKCYLNNNKLNKVYDRSNIECGFVPNVKVNVIQILKLSNEIPCALTSVTFSQLLFSLLQIIRFIPQQSQVSEVNML